MSRPAGHTQCKNPKYHTILTDVQVAHLRFLKEVKGMANKVLAEMFRLKPEYVSKLVTYEVRSHILAKEAQDV